MVIIGDISATITSDIAEYDNHCYWVKIPWKKVKHK